MKYLFIYFLIASGIVRAQLVKEIVFDDDGRMIDRVLSKDVFEEGKMVVKIYQNKRKILIKTKYSFLPWDKNWYFLEKVETIDSIGVKYTIKDALGFEMYFLINKKKTFRMFIKEGSGILYSGKGLNIKYIGGPFGLR